MAETVNISVNENGVSVIAQEEQSAVEANSVILYTGDAPPGEDGGYYVPSVSTEGVLSWTASNEDMPSIESVNIKGEPGKDGEDGLDGDDGVSPTVEISKEGKVTTITFTDAEGEHTATITDGENQTMLANHPVGCWWISDDPTSPAELMGGTWENMAGRVLIGAGAFSSSTSYTVGETGGAIGKNITKRNLPTDAMVSVINDTENTFTVTSYASNSGNEWASGAYKTVTVRTAVNNGVFARETLNVMQPYYATYMWRRIA